MSGTSRSRRDRSSANTNDTASRRRWVLGGLVGLTVVIAVGVVLVSPGRESLAESESQNLAAVPDVILEDFDGNSVALSSLQGEPAVVNFWASWCTPCLAELPGFERVYQAHGESVQFLGINLADDATSALQVALDTGITYPLARDPQGEAFTAFGALAMPTTVFLDQEGRVVELFTGELSADELETKIVDHFEG